MDADSPQSRLNYEQRLGDCAAPGEELEAPPAVRTVLVHDYLLVMRGAERTFAALCDLWPHEPVGSLLYDEQIFGERLVGHEIRTSPLQLLRLQQSNFKRAMPLMPSAIRHIDVSDAELVVSSSSAFAHGIPVRFGSTHVCYCHTPFRYAWYERDRALALAPWAARPLLSQTLKQVRRWDVKAAARGTHYVANSRVTQERMRTYWSVDAPVVSPPVELARFAPGEPEDFFLVVCELVSHKRVDLALDAAAKVGVPVKIVGGGADEGALRSKYRNDKVEFLGRLTDESLASLYARARALILPNIEEFGIAAVEAQACGRPVVAARAGGALETVIEGETGTLFSPGSVDSLAEALEATQIDTFAPSAAIANAGRFSVTGFQQNMLREVNNALGL